MSSDEAVRAAVAEVFTRFTELRSCRAVVLSLLDDGLELPRRRRGDRVEWRPAHLQAVYSMLNNPVYAGVFAYGRTAAKAPGGQHRYRRPLPIEQWGVCIRDHHPGYITFECYEANLAQLQRNAPAPDKAAAAREGSALCQGLVRCGHCGRMMRTVYRAGTPSYRCDAKGVEMVGSVTHCQSVGARRLDSAVVAEVMAVLEPAALEVTAKAISEAEANESTRLSAFEKALERARYEADRAGRQFDACEPENRLVARGLEAAWEESLAAVGRAEAALVV